MRATDPVGFQRAGPNLAKIPFDRESWKELTALHVPHRKAIDCIFRWVNSCTESALRLIA